MLLVVVCKALFTMRVVGVVMRLLRFVVAACCNVVLRLLLCDTVCYCVLYSLLCVVAACPCLLVFKMRCLLFVGVAAVICLVCCLSLLIWL